MSSVDVAQSASAEKVGSSGLGTTVSGGRAALPGGPITRPSGVALYFMLQLSPRSITVPVLSVMP